MSGVDVIKGTTLHGGPYGCFAEFKSVRESLTGIGVVGSVIVFTNGARITSGRVGKHNGS